MGRPQRRPQSVLASSFYMFVSPILSLPYANWASQEGDVFVSPEVLTPVHGFAFAPFSQAFSLLCLLATTILDSFFLFYIPNNNSFFKLFNLYFYLDVSFCYYLCIYSLYHMIIEEVKISQKLFAYSKLIEK